MTLTEVLQLIMAFLGTATLFYAIGKDNGNKKR